MFPNIFADFVLLLGSLYLLIEGGGKWSLDALLNRDRLPLRAPKTSAFDAHVLDQKALAEP